MSERIIKRKLKAIRLEHRRSRFGFSRRCKSEIRRFMAPLTWGVVERTNFIRLRRNLRDCADRRSDRCNTCAGMAEVHIECVVSCNSRPCNSRGSSGRFCSRRSCNSQSIVLYSTRPPKGTNGAPCKLSSKVSYSAALRSTGSTAGALRNRLTP